jgi:AcrR family transcriptional regulator
MSERKQALLDASIRYLLDNGLADLSLRPLAAGIGTSARLLVFHFKSKEGLIEAVLDEVQARVQASFVAVSGAKRRRSVAPMKSFWLWATNEQNLPYLRLLYEAHFIAMQNPRVYARYLRSTSFNWVELIQARLPGPLRDPAFATLCAAVFDGLVIELLSTRDLRRTTRSLDQFVALLERERDRRDRPGPARSARSAH